MTRGWALCLLGALLVPAPVSGQARIFREISIAPYGTLSLGEPIQVSSRVAEWVQEGMLRLPAGLGDARGILVEMESEGRVAGLVLEYALLHAVTSEFNDAVDGYTDMLGEPTYRSWVAESQVDEVERCVYWEDAETRLELVRTTVEDTRTAFAGLFDVGMALAPGRCAALTRIGPLRSGR